MRGLEDAGVVVTRPDAGADRLSRRLAAAGARVLAFPAFALTPLAEAPPTGDFEAVLFTSPAAVRFGVPRLGERLPRERFAPGVGTATALAEAGVSGVSTPRSGAGLTPLLAAMPSAELAGRRLLVVCGRPLNVANLRALAAHGIEAAPFPVYARRPISDPEPLAGWIRSGAVNVIMASSVAAVKTLKSLPIASLFAGTAWIASSPRVADALTQAGAEFVGTAPSAEAGDMARAAIHWWRSEKAHGRA